MDRTFSIDELDAMIEALDSWISKDELGSIMGSLVGGLLIEEGSKRDEFMEKQRVEEQKKNEAKAQRKRRALLIQAKLVNMRDSVVADGITADSLRGAQ